MEHTSIADVKIPAGRIGLGTWAMGGIQWGGTDDDERTSRPTEVSMQGQVSAATTGDVARALADKSLFLPLDDNRTQSVVSAVLSMDASPFLRSGAGSGK